MSRRRSRCWHKAALAAREANSESLAAEVELRQGKVLIQRARFEEAKAIFRDVADKAAKNHDAYQEATAFGNLGFSLLTESRNDEALSWFEKAIVLFETDRSHRVGGAYTRQSGQLLLPAGRLRSGPRSLRKGAGGFREDGESGEPADLDRKCGPGSDGYRRLRIGGQSLPASSRDRPADSEPGVGSALGGESGHRFGAAGPLG